MELKSTRINQMGYMATTRSVPADWSLFPIAGLANNMRITTVAAWTLDMDTGWAFKLEDALTIQPWVLIHDNETNLRRSRGIFVLHMRRAWWACWV
jgi:hypothetical protein